MICPQQKMISISLRVRGIWECRYEALDFTPWLAGNLDLLGRELDMELELVQTEKPIGPLFLDILAKDTSIRARWWLSRTSWSGLTEDTLRN